MVILNAFENCQYGGSEQLGRDQWSKKKTYNTLSNKELRKEKNAETGLAQ